MVSYGVQVLGRLASRRDGVGSLSPPGGARRHQTREPESGTAPAKASPHSCTSQHSQLLAEEEEVLPGQRPATPHESQRMP